MNAPLAVNVPCQLEPLRFPLWGSRLIEASAGTGKTYTIAALYVRLVLGHGGDYGYARALTPPEILVVTFTDAATKELRDRIRVRLAQAAGCFLGAAADDFLQDLRADYPEETWPACARKLQLAAEWMDEAAVSTIHGWCNRMLQEHAFDSDSLFTQTLETDQSELQAEVVRDYWRSYLYPLSEAEAAQILKWWDSPDALQKALKSLLKHTELLGDAAPPAESMRAAKEEKARVLAELKAPWGEWVDALQALLDGAREKKQFNGSKLKKNNYDAWLGALRTWCADRDCDTPVLSDSAWARLCPAGLAEIWKEGVPKPIHPALLALERLAPALAGLPDAYQDILRHCARWVAERFAHEQAKRAQMGFDELLTRLEAALRGRNGPRLAERIRGQFPAGLIDEFQDTDAVQYKIFDTVYRVEENVRDTALILIGDPKQAIYAFRGADIYTYLAARFATEGRHYTLKRNYRATHAMVAATNRCFHLAETREEGEGAFLFRTSDKNPVPFVEANAQGRKEVWQAEDQALPALTAWCLPVDDKGKSLGSDAYREQMAQVCASEMVRLLNLGQQGRAGFAAEGGPRFLRPADLAVLVNTGQEAGIIRAALAARGVRSVYLSEKESVFQRPQAVEMQYWLAACAEPDDSRRLRAALATPTLNLGWETLDRLSHDELAWEARVLQFRDYRVCWQRQGVLPMLRRLLNDFEVPARLLGSTGSEGERSLTDVLHLAELLQQASTLLEGEHALIRYLAEQRQSAAEGKGEARQIRLESDADLVQVVTVHKSKGLEYPLVFLPFACAFRACTDKDLPLKWHDDAGCLQVALSAKGAVLAYADRERLGEDLRKLYVALTRAKYATWIGVAPLKQVERSALGYLLGGGVPLSPETLAAALEALAADCKEMEVILDPASSDTFFAAAGEIARDGAARLPKRAVRENWWIASYSALHGSGESLSADTPQEEDFREVVATTPAPAPGTDSRISGVPSTGPLHTFPRGAEVGGFLHALLQWCAEQGFGRGATNLLRDAVARRCTLRGWEAWIEPLNAWLTHFLGMPIPLPDGVTSFALGELTTYVAEMEFWLAVHQVNVEKIDELVCRHTQGGASRPRLAPGQLNGMLKGFIDLVVEHEGRYFVVDYKSNWLGPDDDAYTKEVMGQTVLKQRYDLQYVLYLLALHRLLKLRLPAYDYDCHIGGALYLFLRGSHAPGQGVHALRPPRELIESLDALFTQPTQCA